MWFCGFPHRSRFDDEPVTSASSFDDDVRTSRHERHRHWDERRDRRAARARRRFVERTAEGTAVPASCGHWWSVDALTADRDRDAVSDSPEDARRRARRRAEAQAGFYAHLLSYVSVISLLAVVNFFTGGPPWFLWPALGWGIGISSHFMNVFGSRMIRERFLDPAIERELRRERAVMQTEKQASIDELSSTIAHEIRNPIAAAKSLVQQMGEDPVSVENVEYAKVALEELDRVERRISHLLRYSKEEDYQLGLVNLASVVDSALTQLRAKLDAANVHVARNYIAGPTVLADAEKLRQVFVNLIDNAIDALGAIAEDRRVDLFIENGSGGATVHIRDNGCGIPPEQIERIFNPFFTTKDTGTGLGMAISKKIVEAHQGSLDVTSTPGHGSDFMVRLPLPPPAN